MQEGRGVRRRDLGRESLEDAYTRVWERRVTDVSFDSILRDLGVRRLRTPRRRGRRGPAAGAKRES